MAEQGLSCNNGVTMPVAAVTSASRQLRPLRRRLALQINRALRSCDARTVHQVRVAIRRFTQAVAVCKSCFSHKDTRKARHRLKKIMSAAGEVRNCDIAGKYLGRWRIPHRDRLQSKLESRRQDAADVLVSELKHWTDRSLTPQDCAASIREMSQHALDRLGKDFLERGNEAASPKASPHNMHRFRIVAKKYRYTLELFQPSNPLVESIKRVSALLGDINDCVTAAEIVPRLGARLKKRQRKKTEEFREYWTAEFQMPRKKPVAIAQTSRRRSAA
jgi:CHAD domain-containing protein